MAACGAVGLSASDSSAARKAEHSDERRIWENPLTATSRLIDRTRLMQGVREAQRTMAGTAPFLSVLIAQRKIFRTLVRECVNLIQCLFHRRSRARLVRA